METTTKTKSYSDYDFVTIASNKTSVRIQHKKIMV